MNHARHLLERRAGFLDGSGLFAGALRQTLACARHLFGGKQRLLGAESELLGDGSQRRDRGPVQQVDGQIHAEQDGELASKHDLQGLGLALGCEIFIRLRLRFD